MPPKPPAPGTLLVLPASLISYTHTLAAFIAFSSAFLVGVSLHYTKIVQNEHFGYPVEWFPSVSATIGDRYPERSVFQLFIAITSGPRFLLVGLVYLLTRGSGKNGGGGNLATWTGVVGVLRGLTCGGWTYVTSTDDHDWHDVFMITYLVLTLPWTVGCTLLTPRSEARALWWRKVTGGAFFATLVPLIYFFIQHKVHRVPGAYTTYAFFEWALVLLDVAFDSVTALDFAGVEIVVRRGSHSLTNGNAGLTNGNRAQSNTSSSSSSYEDASMEKDKPLTLPPTLPLTTDMLTALADVYLAFTFWSTLTGLPVLVWYFPLWHMGISGYEIAVLSSLSPFLLTIPSVRRLVAHNTPSTLLISGLSYYLAYLIKSPELRLLAISVAVALGCLAHATTWWAQRNDSPALERSVVVWLLGLLASSVAKFACWTNNPTWPVLDARNGGWNKTGLLLFALSISQLFSRRRHSSPPPTAKRPSGSSTLASLGLAGLFFALHSLLADSSTMVLTTWTGFPVTGPLAVPHGAWTLATMGAGLVFGLLYPSLIRTWTAFALGAAGAALLTLYDDWTGFYGGLALGFYVMGIAPTLVQAAVSTNAKGPGRVFGVAWAGYCGMLLFHVWVVAYAFVPGGPLVREHTDWVVASMMGLIACGVATALQQQSSTPAPAPGRQQRQRAPLLLILLLLQALSVSVAYLRFPSYDYTPFHPDQNLITAGIWTIHFSLDNDLSSSERRIATLLREAELDVVGLLETDTQRVIMGMRDTSQYLAEEGGYWVDYGPGPDQHTWGCVLLSKFPILRSSHHLLPSPVGELAPAIHATILAYDTEVDVFVFHSGQDEDVEDRRLQSEYLAELMGRNASRPSILLSYLVVQPGEGNYHTYVGDKSGGMRDIDARDWDRWCEYILYRGVKRTGYARVSRGSVTDTELQIGKFVVGAPEPPEEDEVLLYEHTMPEGLRFPGMFQGEGVRGHAYHVLGGPRYYGTLG